jgi:predicted regulator of Ras-like GTPase activity (Roadblock/LC7/MglB family)
MTRSMKVKMFGYVKSLLRKWVETPDEDQGASAVPTAPVLKRKIVMAPSPAAPRTTAPGNGGHPNGRGIELPIQPILAALPLELQPRLQNTDAGDRSISVPLESILAQLSRGSVKIPFGDLRQAAPDLFAPETDWDGVMVPLSLAEVLARLNPALITRRRVQRKVEVPADISSPFDERNQGLVFSVGPTKPESVPAAAPLPRRMTPAAPASVPPAGRGGLGFARTPLPPGAAVPDIPAFNTAPRPLPLREPSISRPTPRPPPPAPSLPVAPSLPAVPSLPAAPVLPTRAAAVPPPANPVNEPEPLLIALTSLAEGWPEAVRQELVQMNLVETRVALPAEVVERALKQGRIAFSWKTLRSWIKPTPPLAPSAHDSTVLELPLKVVAPPFLARQREASKLQKKVVVDNDIPNLFFGFPRPESGSASVASAASPPPAKPPDTNFYVWDETSDRARLQEDETRRGASPGTKFVAKYATPNEVVSRAAALDGVVGALIALPDGLMVASRLPADLNGDTLAAFLPQIFGKINQCTKELRMGELNNVNFTVGNIPWKIFRVNAIFFAAFGRAGEPLPTAQLAALAAELDHRPK